MQNEAILENVVNKHEKEVKANKRSGSVSLANQKDTSVSSMLPTLKISAFDNNNKLTQRQLRIVEIIKGEKVDWAMGKESIGAGMLHESSSLTLRTGGVGNKDGIRSTKAFMT